MARLHRFKCKRLIISNFNVCFVLGYHRHFESELDAALVEYLQTVPENGGLSHREQKPDSFVTRLPI
jgi:hypothetical protein